MKEEIAQELAEYKRRETELLNSLLCSREFVERMNTLHSQFCTIFYCLLVKIQQESKEL